jgi:branched-chain amino acid transport system substrate-binding protein
VRATNPDIVYIGAYPPDNVGIIRAANEIGLAPKMMGGATRRGADALAGAR